MSCNKMAKLINVVHNTHLIEVQIKRRQLPVSCGDIQMLMDLTESGLTFDENKVQEVEAKAFEDKYNVLKREDLKQSLSVTRMQFSQLLSTTVPCVGCRCSVDRLFERLMDHPGLGSGTLYPLIITSNGILQVAAEKLRYPSVICGLLHRSDELLNRLVENQPRNKKSSRCGLHSLDSFRTRPFSEQWTDVWKCMNKLSKEEIAVVEADELKAALDDYLKKHKFCSDCRTKVEKAYGLLMTEPNPEKETGYVPALYSGIKKCVANKHIHLKVNTDFIDSLIRKAEPEINGSHFRHRERHAKTLEIAQEEVLICVGMCIYEKLRRVHVCLNEEENACHVLAAVAACCLARSFNMTVEKKTGISKLELYYEELSREERMKEQRKEQKKLKKRRKRNERRNLRTASVSPNRACDNDAEEEEDEEEEEEDDDDDDDADSEESICACAPSSPSSIAQQQQQQQQKQQQQRKQTQHEDEDESLSSCHSCRADNNNTTTAKTTKVRTAGVCTKRSIDGGYASEHNSSVASSSSSSSSASSTSSSTGSSLNNSPEGSEVACSDGLCNHNDGHTCSPRHSPDVIYSKYYGSSTGFTSTLEQMLNDSPYEDEEENGIPTEYVLEFKLKYKNVKQQRQQLRERLVRSFDRFCVKAAAKQIKNQ